MRRTGKRKYIKKAHGNGIGWQKVVQGWSDMLGLVIGSGECEVAVQAEDGFSLVVGG